ncbi:hypothetical protein TELCIR_25935, partial [Teladorsagia circumcincta]
VFDTKRVIYKEKVDLFFNGLMTRASDDPEGHKVRIKLAALLITLLQSVAAELIVMTVVKHERATSILKVGLPILRKLYDSEDENVKVRALV